jgi:hypothetical protein
VVEAAREAGGRELVRVPFTWPAKGKVAASGQRQGRAGRGLDQHPIRRTSCTMQNSFKAWRLALALAGTAGAASAHRPWMLPTSTIVENRKEAWVTIDGAISEGLFDIDHMPLRMDGLTVTGPDGAPPAPAAVGKLRSSVDLRCRKNGTYRIALVSTNVMGSYKLRRE